MAAREYRLPIAFEIATPATPASGTVAGPYAKSDGRFYGKDDVGTEFLLGGAASFATPAVLLGTAAAAGAASTAIRSDSTIVAFDATVPSALGSAATGSIAFAARRDHVHPTTGLALTGSANTFTTGAQTIQGSLVVSGGNFQVDSSGRIGLGGTIGSDAFLTVGNTHPGSATALYGVSINPIAPSTTTGSFSAYYAKTTTAAASFTLGTSSGFYVETPSLGAASTITNSIALLARNQGVSGVTNAYGIFVDAQSGAATLNVAARLSGGTQANLWLNSDTATAAGGITLGTARDTNIYRAAAGRVGMDGLEVTGGSFKVDSAGRVAVGGNALSTAMLLNANTVAHPGTGTTLYGTVMAPTLPSTTTSIAISFYGRPITAAASFTLGTAYSFYADGAGIGAASAITTAYGFFAQNQGVSGITNAYGLSINAQSGAATLNIGARFGGGTQANVWLDSDTATAAGGISLGTARDTSIFRSAAGVVEIGSVLAVGGPRPTGFTTHPVYVKGATTGLIIATQNSTQNTAKLAGLGGLPYDHVTNQNPIGLMQVRILSANTQLGIGGVVSGDTMYAPTEIQFHAAANVTTTVAAGTQRLLMSDTTLTFADVYNMAFNTGTGTKIGTATGQKLAFWNKAPIAQPTTGITGATFTANTGTAVNDASTFGGYTLKQIAAALVNVGILA